MDYFKSIAFTHKTVGLEKVAKFHIPEDEYDQRLTAFKKELNLDELMFLSTCNRVEIYFCTQSVINDAFLRKFYSQLYPSWSQEELSDVIDLTRVEDGLDAVRHIFHVTGSLDSLVVGEREILTQFRKAYDKALELKLTGDFLRLADRAAIETAKRIFTETDIANRPVSVVNLAARGLMAYNLEQDARILVVGAGVTNTAMLKKLKKQGYHNFAIFNRTFSKAQALANEIGGDAYALNQLDNFTKGFDVILTCTGATEQIITKDLYTHLLQEDTNQKFVVDLAIPNDFDTKIKESHPVELIEVESLKEMAQKNLSERKKAMVFCEQIIDEKLAEFEAVYRDRQIELTVREVPKQVKAIKDKTLNEVFAKQLSQVDEETKLLMGEMLSYMEKKVNAITMKKAKEIFTQRNV